jgi:ComF family protein
MKRILHDGNSQAMFYITMFPDLLTNLFFPRTCVSCGATIVSGAACAVCMKSIAFRGGLACGTCFRTVTMRDPPVCHPSTPYLLGAAAHYQNATVQALVHHLKFRSIEDAAQTLGDIIVRWARDNEFHFENFYVMPIPLSRQRRRMRGYNQAELIARHFAGSFRLPLETKLLIRTRHAKPQSETATLAERTTNIRGVFAIREPDRIRGKNILLIDDVITSGTTFLEASRVVRIGGARSIIALAAAKA